MNVSIRYAKALFQIAKQQNKIDQFMQELDSVRQLFSQDKLLKNFFLDQLADKIRKINVLSVVSDKLNLSKEVVNLIKLLIIGGREQILNDIIISYVGMHDDYKGLIKADVYTAYDMTPTEMNALKTRIKDLFHKEPIVTINKDSSIIGGVRLKVGWTIYDGTIKTHLKDFTNSIKI